MIEEKENLKREDLEFGMTYYLDQQGTEYIFKHDELSADSSNNILASDILGINKGNNYFAIDKGGNAKGINVTINGYECRRATVEEDIWLEECIRTKTRLKKDEALARFNERFT